jgi:putative ABC transport system substrate-binding protein
VNRREFITLLGGVAVSLPLAARAQPPAMPVIGLLGSESSDLLEVRLRVFRQTLSAAGYVEGRNVAIEYRWAGGHNDRLPALAADLIRRQVTVIVTPGSTQAALAAKAATTTIPIVFQVGSDPIQAGLVASLNRPGGNVTGVTSLNMEVGPKRIELLHELVPTATTFALLVNPTNPELTDRVSRDTARATRTLGLQLHVLQASTEREFDAIFARLVELQAGALVIGTDVFFSSRGEQLGALTARHAVAAAYQFRQFAAAGGLMSYGGSITDQYRQLGTYTARILKGERAADLPIQQSTKAELIINLKTAKALGLMVPLPLIGRADEVIE